MTLTAAPNPTPDLGAACRRSPTSPGPSPATPASSACTTWTPTASRPASSGSAAWSAWASPRLRLLPDRERSAWRRATARRYRLPPRTVCSSWTWAASRTRSARRPDVLHRPPPARRRPARRHPGQRLRLGPHPHHVAADLGRDGGAHRCLRLGLGRRRGRAGRPRRQRPVPRAHGRQAEVHGQASEGDRRPHQRRPRVS